MPEAKEEFIGLHQIGPQLEVKIGREVEGVSILLRPRDEGLFPSCIL